MKKKKNAVMVADTRPFLVGHLLLQIKKTNPNLFDEAIIYHENLSDSDKKTMAKIMPCRFIEYIPNLSEYLFYKPNFKKFSKIMFVRYEMFNHLDEYENIMWIDTDTLIQGNLEELLVKAQKNGMAILCEDIINKSAKKTDVNRTNFTIDISGYDMKVPLYCSGLIVVNRKLKNRANLTSWCYKQTVKYADYLNLPDQGILNLMIQEFKIDVTPIGDNGKYGCFPYYQRDCSNAIIIHAWGKNKFWNSWYLYNTFPKWKSYYEEWIKLGGSLSPREFIPSISVIIPVFKPNIIYFKNQLDSIIGQKTNGYENFTDFEIIVVAEPQDDNRLENLILSYKDPRFKLIINKKRLGISASLNIGMKASIGKYIVRADDDDKCAPTRFEKQFNYLENNPEIFLCTSNYEYFGDMNEGRVIFEGEMSKAWSLLTCPFDHPTIMFKRQFFIDNNLFYDEKRKYVEDWELWLRAFDKGLTVGSIQDILYYHRWYNGQAGQVENSIIMMRELVKKNFQKLKIELTDEDVKLVQPWQGKIDVDSIPRLEEIIFKAIENNKLLKLYEKKSLERVFELRMIEAKYGYMEGIVIKTEIHSKNQDNKLNSIKKIFLQPIYKPFKRVYYNIITEAINDNLQKINYELINQINDNLQKINYELINQINEKNKEVNNSIYEIKEELKYINDKLYDSNKQSQLIFSNVLNDLYLKNKIILFGTSEHSNIGDAAITMGEYEFIKKYFPGKKVFEISTYEFFDKLNYISKIINNEDILLLQGGGNLGDKFISEEKVRRYVIENFPNNKIIILPQTIYFSEDAKGIRELEISKEIYNRHQNLTIFTKGKISLKFAKENFSNSKHYTMIDSALNLNYNFNYKRSGIVACIRDINDESGLLKETYNDVINIIKSHDKNYYFTNNLHDFDISKMDRNITVLDQLKLFSQHKLVVTDRLHGLIFSLMTNTPCIVMSSYNYKLKEFTDMLGDNKFVKFIDKNIDILDNEIKNMLDVDISNYKNDFSKEFTKMADIIKKDKNV